MWNEYKQQRLDALRIREAQRVLTDAERAELDAEEAEFMRPAFERMEQRQTALWILKERVETEIAELERIVTEHEKLLADARSYLAQLRLKRR